MADRTPTRFGRLQAGDTHSTTAAGITENFGDVVLSQKVTLTAANTANNPATLEIHGIYDVESVSLTHEAVLSTTSALAIRVGISADTSAYHEFTVSAGEGAEQVTVNAAAVTSRVSSWRENGSAAAITTVQVAHSAASVAAALSAQVTFNYVVRG